MEININDKLESVRDNLTVKELIEEKGLAPQGVGIAINDAFIPQSRWSETTLCPNDKVIIIKAAYGG